MNCDELWQKILGELELQISKANFITWFKNTSILSSENGRVVIGVPNGFAKEWLENKYNLYILKALRNTQNNIREVVCSIKTSDDTSFSENRVDAIQPPKKIILNKPSKALH